MDKVAKFIFHGGTELERAQAETEYTASVLGSVLAEAEELRAAMLKLLDCYWGKGDGEPAPEFIQKAASLCGYKLDQ